MSYELAQYRRMIQRSMHDLSRLSQPCRKVSRCRKPGVLARAVAGAVAEALEGRRLFAVTASLSGGILTVNGSTTADDILVYQAFPNTYVTDHGNPVNNFQTSLITKVVVNGIFLGDTITIANSTNGLFSPVTVGCEIDGGSGDDIIEGGDYNDTIIGGGGADTINGMGGNDLIKGDVSGTSTTSSTTVAGAEDHLSGAIKGVGGAIKGVGSECHSVSS